MSDYQFERALAYYQRGQYQQAIDLLKQLLSSDPNQALYHGILAACLLERKRLFAAEYELKIALQLEPNEPYLLLVGARVLLFKNKIKPALAMCDEALTINPELVEAHLLKSTLYRLIGETLQAKNSLIQAGTLAPDSSTVMVEQGQFYLQTGDKQKALECASNALAKNAEDEQANVLMGSVQLALGNIIDAEYHAKFAITRNPESHAALNLFSQIKLRNSVVTGMWWRMNTKLTNLGNLKASLILVLGFLSFNLMSLIFNDLGYKQLSVVTSNAWVIFVIYSWICIPLYYRQLKKELESFQFGRDF